MRGTVIFDLDGTLVDSVPDLADTLDEVLTGLGLAPVGLEGARALIGHGIPRLVQGALTLRGHDVDDAEATAIVERFVRLYGGRLSQRTRAYPGAEAALERLAGAGWRLAVCTNKREGFSRAILSDLGLLRFFDLVAGPDTFGVAKPDPAHLTRAVPGGGPAVMVGDSIVDVTAARAAGMPAIAVAWGYARGPVADLGADAVAQDFAEVPALVERLAG
ncbi:HAD family hydrolase [Rubellimicrobium roseum]|uniref:Phosphoglycolate phosphatase n=1 Tax=Rubellimicrobium roseum TaxID=687525 RepID=A0A5C4NHA9_9RHOB|nr:HAD family hydrolase [Rubellimicrobium roseum]TNC73310.1 phosphoglycolate phosphatase [Rubellimicrobium roseum]